jgi:hypothetical protein
MIDPENDAGIGKKQPQLSSHLKIFGDTLIDKIISRKITRIILLEFIRSKFGYLSQRRCEEVKGVRDKDVGRFLFVVTIEGTSKSKSPIVRTISIPPTQSSVVKELVEMFVTVFVSTLPNANQ